jgi:hypothetical protein
MYVRIHVCTCMSASVYVRSCARTACETSTSGQKADAAPNRASSTIKVKGHILEHVGIRMCVCAIPPWDTQSPDVGSSSMRAVKA